MATVIADTATGAFQQLPTTEAGVVAFAAGVVKNRARHANRFHSRFVSPPEDFVARPAIDAWREADRVLVARDVAEAMNHLTPRERQVMRLHGLEHWSHHEVAQALGISIHTVKELVRRARRTLKRVLRRYAKA